MKAREQTVQMKKAMKNENKKWNNGWDIRNISTKIKVKKWWDIRNISTKIKVKKWWDIRNISWVASHCQEVLGLLQQHDQFRATPSLTTNTTNTTTNTTVCGELCRSMCGGPNTVSTQLHKFQWIKITSQRDLYKEHHLFLHLVSN